MLVDWIILFVVALIFSLVIELSFQCNESVSVIVFLFDVGILITYMLFFRPKDDFFAIWAFVYGAAVFLGLACLLEEVFYNSDFTGICLLLVIVCLVVVGFLNIDVRKERYSTITTERYEDTLIYSLNIEGVEKSDFTLGYTKLNDEIVYVYNFREDGTFYQATISADRKVSGICDVLSNDEQAYLRRIENVELRIKKETDEVVSENVRTVTYRFYIPKEYYLFNIQTN